MKSNIAIEAKAFDKQILERINHGHIPDLRRCDRCEYFYNNLWRDQHFVNLYYGDLVKKILRSCKKYLAKPLTEIKLLEVGCGPGQVCLELARHGLDVTGIDISGTCINIAQETANNDPWKHSRGKLNYLQKNFLDFKKTFDVILFTASLHHFRDSKKIVSHTAKIAADEGIIVADEPIRDQVTKRNAVIILLIQGLLSAANSYYEKFELPKTEKRIESILNKIYKKEKYENEDGSKLQSINDNTTTFRNMYDSLMSEFKQLEFEKNYGIFHQIIGGIRLKGRKKEVELAKFIKKMDFFLCKYEALDPTNFYFVGKKII